MEAVAIITSTLVAVMFARLLFPLFFLDRDDFFECVRVSFTPDFISLLRGEFLADLSKSTLLSCYTFAIVAVGVLTKLGIDALWSRILEMLST